ncbi:MAG: ATP-binding protein [Polyangiaceae bacterium]|nr:ATP-binding protein [Polyangiaceae bacterium]
MRLAPRLALTFGLLAAVSTAGVGFALRMRLAAEETERFQHEVDGVCARIVDEVRRQGQVDQTLMGGACQGGELVDRVAIAIDRGELGERRTGFSSIVQGERTAFDLDELLLAVEGGDIVGASPTTLLGLPSRDVDHLLERGARGFVLRAGAKPSILSVCTKRTDSGKVVGLAGARHLDGLLDRLSKTLDVTVEPSGAERRASRKNTAAPSPPSPDAERTRATCKLNDDAGASVSFDVLKSTRELEDNLRNVDKTVGLAATVSALVAFVAAIFLARSLSRPLAVLAREAGKVASGEARPLDVRGSGEVTELATAFDRMLRDLSVTRRRLAAASRVAAWREVARRVAHEIKNPLAPIRAAVETLRRLRARDDPRFNDYFDEATRTVLDEVHRIATIVTEFTRFARLPAPKPEDVDIEDVVRHVVQIHKAAAGETMLDFVAQRRAPIVRADRDQIIQVLTNLVQNALDAAKSVAGGAVTIMTDTDGHDVTISVTDNGTGIAPEIAGRLFEPYATTKANGTGLGLAIAQRIALEHNGELSYAGPSANGRGSVFRLLLPIEGPPPASEVPPPESMRL